MAEHNADKAKLLYDFLDQSDFFRGTADAGSRSLMNVCFRAPTEELDAKFIERGRPSADSTGSRATARPGACGPASTTRSRRPASRRWSTFMREFEKANRSAVTA